MNIKETTEVSGDITESQKEQLTNIKFTETMSLSEQQC